MLPSAVATALLPLSTPSIHPRGCPAVQLPAASSTFPRWTSACSQRHVQHSYPDMGSSLAQPKMRLQCSTLQPATAGRPPHSFRHKHSRRMPASWCGPITECSRHASSALLAGPALAFQRPSSTCQHTRCQLMRTCHAPVRIDSCLIVQRQLPAAILLPRHHCGRTSIIHPGAASLKCWPASAQATEAWVHASRCARASGQPPALLA